MFKTSIHVGVKSRRYAGVIEPGHLIYSVSLPTYREMINQVSGPGDGYTYFADWQDEPGIPRVSRRTLKVQEREAAIWQAAISDEVAYPITGSAEYVVPLFFDALPDVEESLVTEYEMGPCGYEPNGQPILTQWWQYPGNAVMCGRCQEFIHFLSWRED